MNIKNNGIALAVAAALAACSGDNSSSLTVNNVQPALPDDDKSRINFQPADGVLPLPSDLLFSGTLDGTLEPPDEADAKADGLAVDYTNPAAALGGADGWSTMLPLSLTLTMVDGATIDATTISGASVKMISTDCGLGFTGCTTFTPLTYGVDFAAVQTSANGLAVAPLTPLDAATTYVVGITNALLDSRGEAVAGSRSYELVTQSTIEEDLSANATLGALQTAINGYETVLGASTATSPDDFIYTTAWTTSSVGSGFTGVLANLLNPLLAPTVTGVQNVGGSPVALTAEVVLEAGLAAQLEAGGLDAATALATAQATIPASFANTNVLEATIDVPYYSGTPNDSAGASDPITDNWKALCDSPITLAQTDTATLAAATPGSNDASCSAIPIPGGGGATFRDLGLDTERHITRYNPFPNLRSTETVEVQITVPSAGAGPWPVVIIQHGITSNKENMLFVTSALSAAGKATIAIDHPLHGSRGLASASLGRDANASSGATATDYMNLENLLVGRDNFNQSIADLLAVRAAVATGVTGANFDNTDVSFLGMSLGGLVGVGFSDTAQKAAAITAGLGLPALDLSLSAVALNVPGGGIGPLLLDSGSFGPVTQGSVVAGVAAGEGAPSVATDFLAFIAGNTAACNAADIGCNYTDYVAGLDAASLAEIQAIVVQFIFAAQTIIDAADPNNFAESLGGLPAPVFVTEIRGDLGSGGTNLPDQVIPNQSSTGGLTFGGTDPLAAFIGLSPVDQDTNNPASEGIVRFNAGHHGSLLIASPTGGVPSADEAAVQTQMQTQIAGFLAGAGVIVDPTSTVVLDQ